jgi:Uma2 family endonuclease
MIASQRPLTYADLLDMPDDGVRREVIGGELRMPPAPTAGHQEVVGNLHIILRTYALSFGGRVLLAPFDVLLGHFDIVQPDLLFLSVGRERIPSDQHAVEGPPDLVVEVISPGTGWVDRTRKMALYATFRVPEYWIADPLRRVIVVNVLDGEEFVAVEPDEDGLITSRMLPGLRVDPAEVFAGLD